VELIVPSDAKVKDEYLRIDAPLRDVVEKLKDCERAKDFIVRYFKKKHLEQCTEQILQRNTMKNELGVEI
jgi:hypothetical protein